MGMSVEDPMVDRSVALLHTNTVTWTACWEERVRPGLPCYGGGKMEDSLAWPA